MLKGKTNSKFETNSFILVNILNDKLDSMIPKVSEHEADNIKLIIKEKIDEIFLGDCEVKTIISESEPGIRLVFRIDKNYQLEAIFDNLHFIDKVGESDLARLANLGIEEINDVIVEQTVDVNIVRSPRTNIGIFMPIFEEFTKFAKVLNYDALHIKDTTSSRISLAKKL